MFVSTDSVPSLPEVFTNPLDVRFESFGMFAEIKYEVLAKGSNQKGDDEVALP